MRVFACPRSPRKITSWPASSAFSSCGRTVSSKPFTTGKSASPDWICVMALRRSSSFTGTEVHPDSRS